MRSIETGIDLACCGVNDVMSVKFAVLGDSIAYGQGASRPSDTVGFRLADRLRETGLEVELRVFAVPGARSDALAGQVRQARGWGANLALIIIGANDLARFVSPEVAARQLGDAVRDLTAANVQVVVTPAPDLSVVPWIPPAARVIVQLGSARLRRAQAVAAVSSGATLADTDGGTSSDFASDVSLFSADRFHPSSKGYGVIARALAPAILTAAAIARS